MFGFAQMPLFMKMMAALATFVGLLAWYAWTQWRARVRRTVERHRELDALATALGLARREDRLRGVVDGHAVQYDGARLRVAFARPLAGAQLSSAAAATRSGDVCIAAGGLDAWCHRAEPSILLPLMQRLLNLARTIEAQRP